jgi:hypothetical protein
VGDYPILNVLAGGLAAFFVLRLLHRLIWGREAMPPIGPELLVSLALIGLGAWGLLAYPTLDVAYGALIGLIADGIFALCTLLAIRGFIKGLFGLNELQTVFIEMFAVMGGEGPDLKAAAKSAATAVRDLHAAFPPKSAKEKEVQRALRDSIRGLVASASREQRERINVQKQLEERDVPYFATAEIRAKLEGQAKQASDLHDRAVVRMLQFHWAGFIAIICGLALTLIAGIYGLVRPGEGNSLPLTIAAIGLIINLVGGGLILFHRAASQNAKEFFDRRQRLEDLQIALDLLTNKVFDAKRDEVLPGFLESLTNRPPD